MTDHMKDMKETKRNYSRNQNNLKYSSSIKSAAANKVTTTVTKMKLSIKDFFSKRDQIWSH